MMREACRRVYLLSCIAIVGCTETVVSPNVERTVCWQLTSFAADVDGAITWIDRDTSANRFSLCMVGTESGGAVHAEGEWWATVRTATYQAATLVIAPGRYEGRYAVWRDTLRIPDLDDRTGSRQGWIPWLAFTRISDRAMRGRYDEMGLVIETQWRRE